jgi:hypothetical protein
MWKKLIAGAVLVVALLVAVVVLHVRAVVGSYTIELLLDGKVVGSGEFTIRMDEFSWSLNRYEEYFSARGSLTVTKPVQEFISQKTYPTEKDRLVISEWYIARDGWVGLMPDVGFQRILIQVPDIRGRVSEGKFGYFHHETEEVFCRCVVTRK